MPETKKPPTPGKRVKALEEAIAKRAIRSEHPDVAVVTEGEPPALAEEVLLGAYDKVSAERKAAVEHAAAVTEELKQARELEDVFPVDTWKEAAPHLRRPFTVAAVRWKVQATWGTGHEGRKAGCLVVPYIDARLVIDRLNTVCPHLWSDEYLPIQGGRQMWCMLTVGDRTRRDVGEGNGKGLVSDSLKRAAVRFGIGISLYALPKIRLAPPEHDEQALVIHDSYWDRKENELVWTLKLTAAGEEHCREVYKKWLDETGAASFGPPLSHGDVEQEALGEEIEAAHEAETLPPAPAAPAQAPPPAAQASPPPAAPAGPETDEERLEAVLNTPGELHDERRAVNELMIEVGAGESQRLKELVTHTSGPALASLRKRVEAVLERRAASAEAAAQAAAEADATGSGS